MKTAHAVLPFLWAAMAIYQLARGEDEQGLLCLVLSYVTRDER